MTERREGFGSWMVAALAAGLVVSVFLTVRAHRVRSESEAREELARLGLENVARQVEQNVRNLRTVREMSDYVSLSRAHSLAQLIAENPSVLKEENRAKFNSYATLLGVDELHVTDARGILVRSLPSQYEGKDMAGSAQSAAFLPALTNATFELVQDPQGKGLATGDAGRDSLIFQYAGVARRDSSGIVQVGYHARRVAEAMKMADVDAIAATMRVGREGHVRIRRLEGAGEASAGYHEETDEKGRRLSVYESDCEGYRIAVVLPGFEVFLGSARAQSMLIVFDLIFVLMLAVALPSVRTRFVRDVRTLREQLAVAGVRRTSFFKMFFSPLALAVFFFFAILLAVIRGEASRSAVHAAESRLRSAAEDVVDKLDGCVDPQLAFIGRELCETYGTPEAMKDLDLMQLMKTYFVDEINVVDGTGRCIASTVPAIRGQDEWSRPNPAKFCAALLKEGKILFSQPFRQSATEKGVYRKYVGVAFPAPAKGFIQIGFERARLHNQIDYRLRELAHNWHVGNRGFYVISKTGNGDILSTLDERCDGETLGSVGFDVFAARMHENVERRDAVSCVFQGFAEFRCFESEFAGEQCLCTSGVVNNFHRYVVALPVSEVHGPARRVMFVTALALLVAFVAVVFFTTKLSNLVASLKGFIAKDKAQREKDLTLAKTIQMSALPLVFPETPQYRVYARMDTAREVGGDFYDVFTRPDGKVVFLVADVSGKGIPAALFMMRAKALVRGAALRGGGDLAAIVSEANDALAESNDAEMFVTAWIGMFDPSTGDIAYVNAGHNAPLVKRADGAVAWLRARSGLVLAAMRGVKYRVLSAKLTPGDSIFLYTDGVTEAMNAAGELYGEERLERTFAASGPEAISAVRHDVALFAGITEQSDDITMLALDFKSN